MSSPTRQPQAIFGPRATGPTIPVITGSLASGSLRRESDSCGPRDTGATTAAIISSTRVTGVRRSGSTAGTFKPTCRGGMGSQDVGYGDFSYPQTQPSFRVQLQSIVERHLIIKQLE